MVILWGGIGFAADVQLNALYDMRTETVKEIALLREKVQNNVNLLRPLNREYLLDQGAINFAEDEEALSALQQRLHKTEETILLIVQRNKLPLPVWANQSPPRESFTGVPPLSFYHPTVVALSDQGDLPIGGIAFLIFFIGGGLGLLLYGIARKLFPGQQEVIYPCLMTFKENQEMKPLCIAFSHRGVGRG